MARDSQGARFGTALITGATGGLGGELARRLAREADALILTGTDAGALERLAAELERAAGLASRPWLATSRSPARPPSSWPPWRHSGSRPTPS